MADETVEMAAHASIGSLAGTIAICEEMRRLGLLDEPATSRIELAIRT